MLVVFDVLCGQFMHMLALLRGFAVLKQYTATAFEVQCIRVPFITQQTRITITIIHFDSPCTNINPVCVAKQTLQLHDITGAPRLRLRHSSSNFQ